MSSYSNELLMLIFRSMLFKQVIILFAYGCLYYLVTHFIDKKIQQSTAASPLFDLNYPQTPLQKK
ncbi:membrane protein [Lactiplantibacillus plantarum]|nr:membrane protein [Lactiplantibacillus plantarum]